MLSYQTKAVKERDELNSRITELGILLATDDKLPIADKRLLRAKLIAMTKYRNILDEIIQRFIINN